MKLKKLFLSLAVVLTAAMLTLVIFAALARPAYAATTKEKKLKKKVAKYIKKKYTSHRKYRKWKVAYKNESNLTYDDVFRRKENKKIIVVREVGFVVDNNKNGATHNGDYISYKGVKCKKGDKVITYLVLNPKNYYEDDYVKRFDVVVKHNRVRNMVGIVIKQSVGDEFTYEVITPADGNVWKVGADYDISIGDILSLSFNNKGTKSRKDDEIIRLDPTGEYVDGEAEIGDDNTLRCFWYGNNYWEHYVEY